MNNIIHLSMARKGVPTFLDVVQSATAPAITFILDDYTPPNNATARIYIKKTNAEVYNNCTINGQEVTFTPSAGSFDEAGQCVAQLQILQGSTVAVSYRIFTRVEPNLILGSAAPSSTEYDALTSLIQDAQRYDSLVNANNWTGVERAQGWRIISSQAGNQDLNTLTDFGTYYCNSTTAAENTANRPPIDASIFRLEVQGHVASSSRTFTYIEQRYYTNNFIFRRVTSDGGTTWGEWRNITNTGIQITDLNNADFNGMYIYGSSAENKPTGTTLGGSVIVTRYSGAYITQLASPNGSITPPRLFVRKMYNGVWQDWFRIVTEAVETGRGVEETKGNMNMTKGELTELAEEEGIEVKKGMTKEDILSAINEGIDGEMEELI